MRQPQNDQAEEFSKLKEQSVQSMTRTRFMFTKEKKSELLVNIEKKKEEKDWKQ